MVNSRNRVVNGTSDGDSDAVVIALPPAALSASARRGRTGAPGATKRASTGAGWQFRRHFLVERATLVQ